MPRNKHLQCDGDADVTDVATENDSLDLYDEFQVMLAKSLNLLWVSKGIASVGLANGVGGAGIGMEQPLVMYLLLREDMLKEPHNWNVGAMCSQAAHAATDCIWKYRNEESVIEYCNQSNFQMRKVTLAVKGLKEIEEISQLLTKDNINFSVWKEQPENVITALATVPIRTKLSYLKKLRLLK